MAVIMSWGWVSNQEFCFGYFEFEMTNLQMGFWGGNWTKKSQKEAQKEVLTADETWRSSAYKIVFNPCTYMRSPIETVWLSKTRILRIEALGIRTFGGWQGRSCQKSWEGEITEATRRTFLQEIAANCVERDQVIWGLCIYWIWLAARKSL